MLLSFMICGTKITNKQNKISIMVVVHTLQSLSIYIYYESCLGLDKRFLITLDDSPLVFWIATIIEKNYKSPKP